MYEDLLAKRLLRIEAVTVAETLRALANAEQDVLTARRLLGLDDDWSLAVAHSAAIQAGRALMYSLGYRPSSVQGHKTVLLFAGATLSGDARHLVDFLDRIRRRRNEAIYDLRGVTTRAEAEEALRAAEEFVDLVKPWMPLG